MKGSLSSVFLLGIGALGPAAGVRGVLEVHTLLLASKPVCLQKPVPDSNHLRVPVRAQDSKASI